MDWLQFAASVIGSLAWPLALVTLVVLLRKPVTRALLELSHLRYKDLEVNFGRELKKLEEKAQTIEVTASEPPPATPELQDPAAMLAEAERLAHDFPEPAVAVAWNAVEMEMYGAALRLGLEPAQARPHVVPAMLLLRRLSAAKAIDAELNDVIRRMQNLRNLAVHGHGGPRVTLDEATEFIALARGVAKKLRQLDS